MFILQVGLSHHTAPVEIREQLAFPEAAIPGALQALGGGNGCGPGTILEGVLLSTCNRLEVYALVECVDRGREDILNYLARVSQVPRETFAPYISVRQNEVAAGHLCRVACGLESMVLGESQIQGQVRCAHLTALAHNSDGPVLNRLFRSALMAGKRARAETAINEHATSISHAAVELALQIFHDLSSKTVVLIGAGEMAELAAKNLVDNGVGKLLVINRSRGRATALAEQFGGQAMGWDRFAQALCSSDIVISSTAAPHAILRPDMATMAMGMRKNQPLFLIDIAVPRDVDPAVGELPNVFLYDIDDMQRVVAANLEQRRREIPRVEAIINQEVKAFTEWFHARDVVPTIVDLRRRVDDIRQAELAWATNKLTNLSEQERNVLLIFSQRLVNKILHQPTVLLKQHANGRQGYHYAEALRDLFGIDDEHELEKEELRG